MGNYPNTLSTLLEEFNKKYEHGGDFIIKHVSIQYLLDELQHVNKNSSVLELFHFTLLNSLLYSEHSERDVTHIISHLTTCPLGSVTSFVTFNSFKRIVDSGDVDVMIKLGRYLILSEFLISINQEWVESHCHSSLLRNIYSLIEC